MIIVLFARFYIYVKYLHVTIIEKARGSETALKSSNLQT